MKCTCLLLVVGFVLTAVRFSPAQSVPQTPGRQYCLIVACSTYPELRRLHGEEKYASDYHLLGPENDAKLIKSVLVDVLHVDLANITELVGWPEAEVSRPTRANILLQLNALSSRKYLDGDRVIIYLCGHGSQQNDTSGDEPDKWDEVFLPADVTGWDGTRDSKITNCITDDELGQKLRAIRNAGAKVWIVMDCCNSGSGMRGLDLQRVIRQRVIRQRVIRPDQLGVPETPTSYPEPASQGGPLDLGESDRQGIVALYASQSFKDAPEIKFTGSDRKDVYHGRLTYVLARTLRRYGCDLSFAELQRYITRTVVSDLKLNDGSIPQIDGDGDMRVGGGRADSKLILMLERSGGQLVLNAGELHGVHPGTKLEAFEPGKRGHVDASLGCVEVKDVYLHQSTCAGIEWKGKSFAVLEDGLYPAQIVERRFGDHRLQLGVIDEQGRPATKAALSKEVLKCLARFPQKFALVEPDEIDRAHWFLVPDGGRTLLLPARARSGDYRCFAFDSSTLAANLPGSKKDENLTSVLARMFRLQNLVRLAGMDTYAGLPADLNFHVLRVDADGKEMTMSSGANVVHPGDGIYLHLKNETGRTYDIWVFFIDANGKFTTAFPRAGDPRLTPKDSEKIRIPGQGSITVTDDPLGMEHFLVIALERTGKDEKIWLDWLASDPGDVSRSDRSGAAGGAFGKFLDKLAFGGGVRRGPSPLTGLNASLSLFTYKTTWGKIQPPEVSAKDAVLCLTAANVLDFLTGGEWSAASINHARYRGGLSELYARVSPAIFVVRTGKTYGRMSYGTGFLVDSVGQVLTNHHVVDGGTTFDEFGRDQVELFGGRITADGTMQLAKKPLRAVVLLKDQKRDLALLEIQKPGRRLQKVTPIAMAKTFPRPGQTCFMVGHPSSGLLWTVRQGLVSGIGRCPSDLCQDLVFRLGIPDSHRRRARKQLEEIKSCKMVLSSCPGNPGDSGGPLLDEAGNLIGVTFAIPASVRDDKFVYHVHQKEVVDFLKRAPKHGAPLQPAVPDPWLLGAWVRLGRTSEARRGEYDLLITGKPSWRATSRPRRLSRVLLDLDNDANCRVADAGAIHKLVKTRSFDAEVAFHFLADRNIAFYDTQNDTKFDLILVDLGRDGRSDASFTLKKGRWVFDNKVGLPWMSTRYLAFLDANETLKVKAIKKFRSFRSIH